MSSQAVTALDDDENEAAGAKKPGGKKKLLIVVGVLILLLAGAGAGLWFSGLLPAWLGRGAAHADASATAAQPAPAAPQRQPVFMDMPEIVANLNAPGRRPVFMRLRSKLEVSRPEDIAVLQNAMPRLLDLFQVYLREMRPEEMRGSIGTQRLREELMLRANLAASPARITDILFTEILVQ